jgi:uncharacterized DUF497 family protein
MKQVKFDRDENKNLENQTKHNVSFEIAQYAFADPNRILAEDLTHSQDEKRYYCIGKVDDEILTLRFTYRTDVFEFSVQGTGEKEKNI